MSDNLAVKPKVFCIIGPLLITRAGNIESLHLMHESIPWGEKSGFRGTDSPD